MAAQHEMCMQRLQTKDFTENWIKHRLAQLKIKVFVQQRNAYFIADRVIYLVEQLKGDVLLENINNRQV